MFSRDQHRLFQKKGILKAFTRIELSGVSMSMKTLTQVVIKGRKPNEL